MSACVFSKPLSTPLLYYDEVVGDCSGDCSSLSKVKSLKYPLYGANNSLDLLLLRGGRIVNWKNSKEVAEVESGSVCEFHLSSLLLSWDRNRVGTKLNKTGQVVCSLHGIKHPRKIPVAGNKLMKTQAIEYMEHLRSAVHVGTAVCTTHLNALNNSKFDAFAATVNHRQEPSEDQQFMHSYDIFDDPTYVQIDDQTPEPADPKASDPTRSLRSILAEFGIKRLTSGLPWLQLDEDTKHRKVRAVIQFLDKLFAISAGDDWKLMKNDFLIRMKLIGKDTRVESIMGTIGECLEESNNKAVRISVLKLVTGLFSEKEITKATGASRYLIRQAKVSAFEEVRMIKQFIRERYDKLKVQIFLRFLARPEILTFLPNLCKPSEIIDGFIHNFLLEGCSYYLIEVEETESSNASIEGIKTLSSFRFESGKGVRVRRHDSLGVGVVVPKAKLVPIVLKYTIHRQEGHLSESENFWKEIGSVDAMKNSSNRDEPMREEKDIEQKEFLNCSDMLCKSRFLTKRGLEMHVTRGKHDYYRDSKTVTDYGAQFFSNIVETTEEAQVAVHADSQVPIVPGAKAEERKPGWALRSNERPGRLDPEVKKEVEILVRAQLDGGMRAEAKEIKDQIRDLKNDDGSYRFSLKKCLSEGQIKSQITRVLNLKKKETDNLNGDTDKSLPNAVNGRGGKRKKNQAVSDTQIPKKRRGRPSKKAQDIVNSDSDEEEKEEGGTDIEDEGEIDCVELMEQEIGKMIDDIFETD